MADWLEEAKTLLRPFVDPGSDIEVRRARARAAHTLAYFRGGRSKSVVVLKNSDGQLVFGKSKKDARTFKQWLVGYVLDVRALAKQCVRLARAASQLISPPGYVNSKYTPADSWLLKSLKVPPEGMTSVVIVDGPAGIGKTYLLEWAAKKMSQSYLNGSRGRPALFVSSRGRRLSRLDDAIAATLQEHRSSICYWEIPALVQLGLLDLYIDGFDELSDHLGYKHAWGSLADFIAQLAGKGTIVVSARSSFLEATPFGEALKRSRDGDVKTQQLTLSPWQTHHVIEVAKQCGAAKDKVDFLADLSESDPSGLFRRPYFVVEAVKHFDSVSDLKERPRIPLLVRRFVEREVTRLFGRRQTNDAEFSRDLSLLERFFELIAEEMAGADSHVIDTESMAFFLSELLEEQGRGEDEAAAMVARVSSIALLEGHGGASSAERQFPHEIVMYHFLASRIVKLLQTNSFQLRTLLQSVQFTEGLLQSLIEILASKKQLEDSGLNGGWHQQLTWLAGLSDQARPYTWLRWNIGSSYLALTVYSGASVSQIPPIEVGHFSFRGLKLASCRVQGASFVSLDLVATDISAWSFSPGCSIGRLRASSATKISGSLPCPEALELVRPSGRVELLFDPCEIEKAMKDFSVADPTRSLSARELDNESYFESLLRIWLRQHFVSPADEEYSAFRDPRWDAIEQLLEAEGRVRVHGSQTGGSKKRLVHIRQPLALLERTHPDPKQQPVIDRIWEAVRSL